MWGKDLDLPYSPLGAWAREANFSIRFAYLVKIMTSLGQCSEAIGRSEQVACDASRG